MCADIKESKVGVGATRGVVRAKVKGSAFCDSKLFTGMEPCELLNVLECSFPK